MSIRMTVLALATGVLALAPMRSTDLPEQKLPVFGGSGGTAFTRDCGAGRVLTGFRYRVGTSVDAIGVLCRPVNADGSLGSETTVGTLAGGGGGTFGTKRCPAGTVVTGGIMKYGSFVDLVVFGCSPWSKSTRTYSKPATAADSFGRALFNTEGRADCEATSQPVTAIRGRAAGLVDALGFICDEP
jgi:hypothetical protein